MAEPSITNTENISDFKLNPENKLIKPISSFCDSEFNPQFHNKFYTFRLIPVVEFRKLIPFLMDSVVNPEIFFNFLKILENVESSDDKDFDFSHILLLNCGNQIVGFNLITLINGETAVSSDASVSSSILSSMKTFPVRTLANVDPGDVLRLMKLMVINDGNGGDEGGGIDGGNGGNDPGGNRNVSGGGDDNGDGSGDGDSNGDNGSEWWKSWVEPVRVHGISVYLKDGSSFCNPSIVTGTYGSEYNSWNDISGALLDLWIEVNEEYMDIDSSKYPDPEKEDVNPYCCVPGCVTLYGRYEGDYFYNFEWYKYEWEDIQGLVKDVMVLRPAKSPGTTD